MAGVDRDFGKFQKKMLPSMELVAKHALCSRAVTFWKLPSGLIRHQFGSHWILVMVIVWAFSELVAIMASFIVGSLSLSLECTETLDQY